MIKSDLTLLIYRIEFVVYFITALLFLWWAIYKYFKEQSPPSTIYFLVMLWFFSQGYATAIGYHARTLRFDVGYYEYMQGIWWDTRAIPRLIIAALICWRQLLKVYVEFFKKQKRRRSDKDGEDV